MFIKVKNEAKPEILFFPLNNEDFLVFFENTSFRRYVTGDTLIIEMTFAM